MKPALLLSLIILACTLSGQETPTNSGVENLVHNYCGEDPVLSDKEVAVRVQRMEKMLYDQCVARDPLSDCTTYAAKNTEVSQWRHPLGTDNRETQNEQVKSYLRCREIVIKKALDAHVVALEEENERLSKALLPLCALPSTSVSPKVHQLITQACAALLPPNP